MAAVFLIPSPTLLSHPSPQPSSSSLPVTFFHHRKIQTHHRPKRNNHLVPQSAVGEISVSYSPPPQKSTPELKLKLLSTPLVSGVRACELERKGVKANTISAVSGLNRGLAATEDDIQKADAAAKELEAVGGPVDLSADLDKLQGRWKLIYSSAFSSRTLGGSRPGPPTGRLLPITLGQVFQRIDIFGKDFDNIVELKLGTPWPIPPIELTATLAHKFELIGSSKIKITFEKTTVKTGGNLSQIPPLEIPRIPDFLRPPSNTGSGEFEVTYMDSDTRITRGDRAELRVFVTS
ncbi:unnamed protein product [Camellia sinensis]